MAEENETENENENEIVKEKGGGGIRTIILASVIALILGAVGGAFASGFFDDSDDASPENAESSDADDDTRIITKTVTYDLGEFSLNLKDPSTMRILQMSIVVECETGAVAEIEKQHAQLRDVVIMFTSEYTVPSLAGLEGKMNLRDEVLMRINAILKPHRVERIYFTNFIIGK